MSVEGKISTRPKVGTCLMCLKNTEEESVVEISHQDRVVGCEVRKTIGCQTMQNLEVIVRTLTLTLSEVGGCWRV